MKDEEGFNDVGFAKEFILIMMTVDAGKTEAEILPNSKYWTELSVKGVTGQLCYGVVVKLVYVSEKNAERVAPTEISEGRPECNKKITYPDFGIGKKLCLYRVRNRINRLLGNSRQQIAHRGNSDGGGSHLDSLIGAVIGGISRCLSVERIDRKNVRSFSGV